MRRRLDTGPGAAAPWRARGRPAAPIARSRAALPAPADDITDDALIALLLARDAAAYRFAVARYTGPMLAAARALGGGELAEDIVQDAWLAALTALPGFERRASLKTWLLRIVANKTVSRLRARREISAGALTLGNDDDTAGWFDTRGHWLKDLPPHWHDQSPEALLGTHALQECLDKHLGRMPEQQRNVLTLREQQGMALDDICVVLGVSAANVRVLLHRARLRLVAMVNRYEETGEC